MKDLLGEETARLCLPVYRDRLRAVVLTGSLARNEGTFVKDEQGTRLFGDAEFLLVFRQSASLPSDAELHMVRQKIEERVRHRGLRAAVTLSVVRSPYLRRLPPSIFAYELRACGETIAGDPRVLAEIPDFTPADTPLDDAWRLLANRIVEQLGSIDDLLEGGAGLSPRVRYRTVKLYLDMATSYLVFVGRYAPTYAQRLENLLALAHADKRTAAPLSITEFAADVSACTRWKLAPTDQPYPDRAAFVERGLEYARNLWRWELARLAAAPLDLDDTALLEHWTRRQPLRSRMRGWLHVARREGWLKSYRSWPHWIRLAARTSPRHAVYTVASRLSFCAPESVAGSPSPSDWDHLRRCLPVSTSTELRPGQSGWHQVAADVTFNYSRFLVDTRA